MLIQKEYRCMILKRCLNTFIFIQVVFQYSFDFIEQWGESVCFLITITFIYL